MRFFWHRATSKDIYISPKGLPFGFHTSVLTSEKSFNEPKGVTVLDTKGQIARGQKIRSHKITSPGVKSLDGQITRRSKYQLKMVEIE